MNAGEEFVGNFLKHYASEYYDPAKAREYYLRTRELKGKRSTGGLTVKGDTAGNEERKTTWAYTKNQIDLAKKGKLEAASEERKNFLDRTRQAAQLRREEISNKLSNLLKSLTEKHSEESEDISEAKSLALERLAAQQKAKSDRILEEAQRKIAALPPIPAGVSETQYTLLIRKRAQKIAQIRGTANTDLDAVANESASEREAISAATDTDRQVLDKYTQEKKEGERKTATADRETVRTELKATVEKARVDYEALKEKITAEYEATAQREYDAIRGNLPAPSSTKKASSKTSEKKSDKKSDKPKGSKSKGKSISLEEAARQYVQRRNSK
jgi:hypothetical protein